MCMDDQFVWSFVTDSLYSGEASIFWLNISTEVWLVNSIQQQHMWYTGFDCSLNKSDDICSYWLIWCMELRNRSLVKHPRLDHDTWINNQSTCLIRSDCCDRIRVFRNQKRIKCWCEMRRWFNVNRSYWNPRLICVVWSNVEF